MATNILFQENYVALSGMVKSWDRRLRMRQMLLWLPRSLLPGLAIGIALAVVSRLRPWLMPQQIALATGGLVALGVVVFALGVWLWRRSSLTSARRFDVQFRLGERISTALELSDGTIHSSDELALLQLEDARIRASEVRVRDHIPLALSRRDWVIVLVLAATLALLLVLPNPQIDALAQASAEQTALDNAAEQMRETTQDIAADASLGNEERQALLEQLQTTTSTLEQPNITPEEAFAAVSDMQSDLQDISGELNRQSSASQSALEQAAAALRQIGQQSGEAADNAQAAGTMEQVTQNLDQIAQNAAQMSAEQRQQAADALQNAAQQMQNTNPQAAQNLNDAAQQMQQQNLNQQQLQQSLNQAQQQMQQQSQQAQQQQQASQNLNNQAQQMQQSAQQISQSQNQQGQQEQQQSQQNQQNQQQQSQQAQQQSQQSQQGQQSQDGQQSQQGEQSQNGNQQGQQNQNGAAEMAQQGSENAAQSQAQQSAPGERDQQQQGNAAQQAQILAAGNQPGDPQGSDSQAANQQLTSSQDQSPNNADGQGEGEFEAVNVPQRIGAQPNDGNNVQLDPDSSNAPVQEGDFSQNPNGQVTVPYNQVFSDYADSANRALDSDYVPLGLRDVVRDYFTSLEPRR